MDITDEILAAYVDGLLSEQQNADVRNYISTHPHELELIIKLMDNETDEHLISVDNDYNCMLPKDSVFDFMLSPSIIGASTASLFAPANNNISKYKQTNIQKTWTLF